MTLPRRALLALLLLAQLACSVPAVPSRSADWPFRRSEPAPFTLAWRLDRDTKRVTAVGVLDVDGLAGRLMDATVELRGLDGSGRMVSRGTVLVEPPGFQDRGAWPFRVSLRPAGLEVTFEVALADYRWKPIVGGD